MRSVRTSIEGSLLRSANQEAAPKLASLAVRPDVDVLATTYALRLGNDQVEPGADHHEEWADSSLISRLVRLLLVTLEAARK